MSNPFATNIEKTNLSNPIAVYLENNSKLCEVQLRVRIHLLKNRDVVVFLASASVVLVGHVDYQERGIEKWKCF